MYFLFGHIFTIIVDVFRQLQNNNNTSEKNILDVAITLIPPGASCEDDRSRWCPRAPSKWQLERNIKLGNPTPMSEQVSKFAHILSVDGVGCADRLKSLLMSSSVLYKQDSSYREFWYADLIDGIHYKLVNNNFSNIIDVFKDVVPNSKENKDLMIKIILNANDYASTFLTKKAHMCYLRELIKTDSRKFDPKISCVASNNALPLHKWVYIQSKNIKKASQNHANETVFKTKNA